MWKFKASPSRQQQEHRIKCSKRFFSYTWRVYWAQYDCLWFHQDCQMLKFCNFTVFNLSRRYSGHLKCCYCWGCWAEPDPSEQKRFGRSGETAAASASASSIWTTRSSHQRASSTEGQTAGQWVPVFSTGVEALMRWMECIFSQWDGHSSNTKVIRSALYTLFLFFLNVTSGFLL